jgi:hypothetical protein
MIRPFYQSLLLWLGLPGFAFLVWCWWDSGDRCTEIRWSRSHSVAALYVFDGRVCVVLSEEAPEAAPVFPGPAIQVHRGRIPLLSRGGRKGSLFAPGSGLNRAELEARQHFAPGMYCLRWSFPYYPHPGFTGTLPWLPFREWGFNLGWVLGCYAALLSLAVAAWQRRKHRLMKLQMGPP